uniref:Membrane protein containing PspC domain protein n=1 Tax=uncultured organism TaxID=155900 RepID=M1PW55_9ZZZZ|nr:membrane protein containing PspC domain protein [uncultured organism]
MLGGVCGGIAEYFNIDPTLIRLAFVLFFFADGAGILAYIIGWFIIPEKKKTDNDYHTKSGTSDDNYSEASTGYHEYQKKESETENSRKETKTEDDSFSFKLKGGSQRMWGLLLVLIGGAFLVRYWFPFVFVEKMWPLLIILVGLAFLLKGKKGE